MNGILFLAVRMQRGFGVSIVVNEVARNLVKLRIPVAVGCMESEGRFDDFPVEQIPPDPRSVARLAEHHGCRTVVALTSPFFEALPTLSRRLACWAWEWGDPTADFFQTDRDARARIIQNKQERVYPTLAGVIAGSDFLRTDIGWPAARVVLPAADHAPDLGPKTFSVGLSRSGKLRVGTLMRLGAGESLYKGDRLFRELKASCELQGVDCSFLVAGRGTEEDARPFRDEGMEVHLSITEDEKWDYLRDLDVFVSCSMWEGFNLPLAEAQAVGTVGLAFDIGAHPAVTPFVMGSIAEVVAQIRSYSRNTGLLHAHALAGYRFIRSQYSWRETTRSFLEALSTPQRSL